MSCPEASLDLVAIGPAADLAIQHIASAVDDQIRGQRSHTVACRKLRPVGRAGVDPRNVQTSAEPALETVDRRPCHEASASPVRIDVEQDRSPCRSTDSKCALRVIASARTQNEIGAQHRAELHGKCEATDPCAAGSVFAPLGPDARGEKCGERHDKAVAQGWVHAAGHQVRVGDDGPETREVTRLRSPVPVAPGCLLRSGRGQDSRRPHGRARAVRRRTRRRSFRPG